MYRFVKKLLFLFDPETAHQITMKLLEVTGFAGFLGSRISDKRLTITKKGLTFPNPVGLAAGFDKDAKYIGILAKLGFGFLEIGTLTPKPQPGNDRPRLFRLVEDEALINRMGFNNGGVDEAVERLKTSKGSVLIGGNIGKNKVTPNEDAISDYLTCFRRLYEFVDYFVVNISSPNTPGLRDLQTPEFISSLFRELKNLQDTLPKRKPVLLKIAPDLSDEQLTDIIQVVKEENIDGVIATNTTISRDGLSSQKKTETGGLSGSPLTKSSNEIVRKLRQSTGEDLLIIGVGGIMSADDAIERIEAGADVVQLYTGFVYQGPTLIKSINQKILNKKT